MFYRAYELDREKVCTSLACQVFKKLGISFEWDNDNKCWDVETPDGWKTATTGFQLWSIAKDLQ